MPKRPGEYGFIPGAEEQIPTSATEDAATVLSFADGAVGLIKAGPQLLTKLAVWTGFRAVEPTAISVVGSTSNLTRVGRWMSREEYALMQQTGKIQEGAGGATYVVTSGPASFYKQAHPGSIYVEFSVPAKSLVQGGQADWFKLLGPGAPKSMKFILERQGGKLLPLEVELLSFIQAVKPK